MYANVTPHASATPPGASPSHQPLAPQAEANISGHTPGMQPALPGGPHGIQQNAYVAPHPALQAAPQPARLTGAAYTTGAYESTGDAAIDRMIRLEAAAKRFGSPF